MEIISPYLKQNYFDKFLTNLNLFLQNLELFLGKMLTEDSEESDGLPEVNVHINEGSGMFIANISTKNGSRTVVNCAYCLGLGKEEVCICGTDSSED